VPCEHRVNDRIDKAAVFSQGFVIAGKKSGFDSIFGGRSDKLDTTDEY
jgi:hypothetical protein